MRENGNANDRLSQHGNYNLQTWISTRGIDARTRKYGDHLKTSGYVAFVDADEQQSIDDGGSAYGTVMSSVGLDALADGEMKSGKIVTAGVFSENGEEKPDGMAVTLFVYGAGTLRNTWKYPIALHEGLYVTRAKGARRSFLGKHKDMPHKDVCVPLVYVKERLDAEDVEPGMSESLNTMVAEDGGEIYLGRVMKSANGGYISHVLLAEPYPSVITRGQRKWKRPRRRGGKKAEENTTEGDSKEAEDDGNTEAEAEAEVGEKKTKGKRKRTGKGKKEVSNPKQEQTYVDDGLYDS